MNRLIVLLIFTYLTLGIQAAEWISSFRHEKFPGKCAITTQLILNEGVSIKDPQHDCRRIVCGSKGNAMFQSCGSISGLPKSCHFGNYVNVEASYPKCCERKVICN